MNFSTADELLALCDNENLKISEVMLSREEQLLSITKEDVIKKLGDSYNIMKNAANTALTNPSVSVGGLIGGEAKRVYDYSKRGSTVIGELMAEAVAYALGVLEVNASMGLIVAAPTAGASGILPGALLALENKYQFDEGRIIDGLLNASAIGYLIARHASIAGAEGGCQAEVGSASAMTASAVTELMGGSPKQSLYAASIALSNLMGLICDPVAGLVEVPCQNRNAAGVSNALVCAEMALSGITFMVPLDETIKAMSEVGLNMPKQFRETADGGLAATPAACKACRQIMNK